MFILTLLVAIAMSYVAVTIRDCRRQKAAADVITRAGGSVLSDRTLLGILLRDDSFVSVPYPSMTEPSIINRIAIMLIPTEACLDWINSCDDDKMTLEESQKEPTVFLVPEGSGEPESQVRRHFKAMFEEELYSWYTDQNLWPKDLSFAAFKKFFTIQLSSMVFDLGEGMIIKEDD